MDKESLFKFLAGTLDANVHTRKESEQQLQNYEKQPGFTEYLLDLIVQDDVPTSVQFSAAIYFKNRVIHHWVEPQERSTNAAFRIQDFEKNSIKEKLIKTLIHTCTIQRIRLQLQESLLKIFNAEKWDEIIPIIKQLIQDKSNINHVYTSLIILFEYAKCYRWSVLDSNSCNPIFEDITTELFPDIEILLQHLIDSDDYQLNDEMIYLILKIFKYITFSVLPTYLKQDQNKLGLWCQYHILIINKPLPNSVLNEEDISIRNQNFRIKSIKWSFGNLKRLLQRHGGGRETAIKDSPFATSFIQNFVPEILNVYWSIIEKWSSKKIWISDGSLYHMISFLRELIPTPAWALIQDKLEAILTHVVLPTLCATNESVELYEDDQEEYIRRFFNINRETNSADIASINFIDTLIASKFAISINILLNIINGIMNARANPSRDHLATAMQVEGVFRILSAISYKLDKKFSPTHGKIDQLLFNYVYPELSEETINTTPFLTARACDTIAMFGHKYNDQTILQNIFQAIVRCFQNQENLPIQITAVDALRTLVNEELVADHIADKAPQLMETLLAMSKKFESDVLTSVMEAFVQKFARNLEPYAKELTANLSAQFIKLASDIMENGNDGKNDIDKEYQASGILSTISTLVIAMNSSPQVAVSLEPIVEEMIKFIFDSALVSFISEAVDILESLVYSTETISPILWSLYQACIDSFELYALEYFDAFQPFFECIINYGFTKPQQTIDSPHVQALISVCFNVIKSDYVEPIFADSAFQLLEMTCLSLNKRFVPFLDRFLPEIFDVFTELEAQDAFDGYMLHHLSILRTFFACIFVEPNPTLQFIQSKNFMNSFIQLWIKHSDDFHSVYGCKLQILALLAILVDADLSMFENQQDTIRELADLLISTLEVLPHAIKARQDIINNDRSLKVVNDDENGNEEADEYDGAYDEIDDFEADEAELEALKQTPIDNIHVFEVFSNKFTYLQQNTNKYEAIFGGMDDQQLDIVNKIIQVSQQQQQQQQQQQ